MFNMNNQSILQSLFNSIKSATSITKYLFQYKPLNTHNWPINSHLCQVHFFNAVSVIYLKHNITVSI